MPDSTLPNLYLVGFMATGKSTFGRMVAMRLGMRFIDVDTEIERAEHMPISKIFETRGEPAFRTLERQFIETGHPDCGCIVATGGGLVCQPGMLELLRARGVVICLHASEHAILSRTLNRTDRPLLATDDPAERIRTLLASRLPIYEKAGTMILTDARPLGDVANHIIRVYRRDARDAARRHVG
jgi:shikimate kinase